MTPDTDPHADLDPGRIEEHLALLGAKLHTRGVTGQILLLGGAYMLLVVRNREATKDIDAYFFSEPRAIRDAAAEVAREQGLPDGWLNDAVKGFMYRQPRGLQLWLEYPGLKVFVPPVDYVFAMKAHSARVETFDLDDLRALRSRMSLRSLQEGLAVYEKYVPERLRSSKARLALEAVWAENEDEGGAST